MSTWVGAVDNHYQFAAPATTEEVSLWLRLRLDDATSGPPDLLARTAHGELTVTVSPKGCPGEFDVIISGQLPTSPSGGDSVEIRVTAADGREISECRAELRRPACAISSALLLRDAEAVPLRPHTVAALLWLAWERYAELVGLKRFTTGKSGSDVLVFQPRLCPPRHQHPAFISAVSLNVTADAWGSALLVKTGARSKVLEEFERYSTFLADRQHPFMSRSEHLLTVLPVGMPWYTVRENGKIDDEPQATLIGTFLGGNLLRAEPFEALVRSASDPARIEAVLDKVFAIAGTWYASSDTGRLGDWWKVFRGAGPRGGEPPLHLFGKFDFNREKRPVDAEKPLGRHDFVRALMWDVAFSQEQHLRDHLIGKGGPGLLYRLMDLPVRFSLIHGDLQTRNILVDDTNTWLIDFGETGIGPTLFDFAKLDVRTVFWCLDLAPGGDNLEDEAQQLETLLLDHFTATEAALEPICRLAPRLGVDDDDLLGVARCISGIRRHALRYCVSQRPDQREYLAVLFLTVLNTLQYAGSDTAPVSNFRLLMSLFWVLEDTLSRAVGMEPVNRGRMPVQMEPLVRREWLDPPEAPRRILYWLSRPDGCRALAPLAAARGVLQGHGHHLDVFDHTLLVLAYVEEILRDPLAMLTDPHGLDTRVGAAYRSQGLSYVPPQDPGTRLRGTVPDWLRTHDALIGEGLSRCMTPLAHSMLKTLALFHDVGKPATRVMTLHRKTGAPQIQFMGHPQYGCLLVGSQLRSLFPDSVGYEVVSELLVRHHEHHDQIVRYAEPRRLEYLRRALAGEPLHPQERRFLQPRCERVPAPVEGFPLLLILGYADALAARGPGAPQRMEKIAEIDLALLAIYFERAAIWSRESPDKEFDRLTAGFAGRSDSRAGEAPLEQHPGFGATMRRLSDEFKAAPEALGSREALWERLLQLLDEKGA